MQLFFSFCVTFSLDFILNHSKNMANYFEVFLQLFSSSMNLLFLKSVFHIMFMLLLHYSFNNIRLIQQSLVLVTILYVSPTCGVSVFPSSFARKDEFWVRKKRGQKRHFDPGECATKCYLEGSIYSASLVYKLSLYGWDKF